MIVVAMIVMSHEYNAYSIVCCSHSDRWWYVVIIMSSSIFNINADAKNRLLTFSNHMASTIPISPCDQNLPLLDSARRSGSVKISWIFFPNILHPGIHNGKVDRWWVSVVEASGGRRSGQSTPRASNGSLSRECKEHLNWTIMSC